MIDEKKVNTTEEAKKNVKVEEDSEKLNDEQMAQVSGGTWSPSSGNVPVLQEPQLEPSGCY